MSKIGVCSLSLGYTRLAGLLVYDTRTRDFTETTPKPAKKMIDQGILHGVLWDKATEQFVPDPKFNRDDILVKSGVGNYRKLLHEVPGEIVNSDYLVVRVLKTNKGDLYEVVNNKCQRVKLSEEKLRGLNEIGKVGGVFITDDEIKICDGVVIQNRVYPDEVQLDMTPLEEALDTPANAMPEEQNGAEEKDDHFGEVIQPDEFKQEDTETEVEPSESESENADAEEDVAEKEPTLSELFGEEEPAVAEDTGKNTGSKKSSRKKK